MVAMPQKPDSVPMTEAEYLDFEAQSEVKHEFSGSEAYAMTGASWNHNVICQNTSSALANQLADRECTVVSNDLRLSIRAKKAYRYPDVIVVCGEPQFAGNRVDTITNPVVIVEVLSPATALIDRNDKLDEYIQIPSLQAYLLIAQHELKVERYLRHKSGNWLYSVASGRDASLDLPFIGCTLPLAAVYKKLNFDSDTTG
jgi:Uma2 family endonuclease